MCAIGDTVIVLSRIQLFALVGGNEARNPFTVTETYVKRSGGIGSSRPWLSRGA